MWRWTASYCLVAWLTAEITHAQELAPVGTLLSRRGWVQLDVVLGRITAVNVRHCQSLNESVATPESGRIEKLSLSVEAGVPTVFYESLQLEQHLTVEIIDANQVSIQREPANNSAVAAVQFLQKPAGDLILIVNGPAGKQEYHADSLWHLLLAQPDPCREHLLPLLDGLRPNWQLADTASQIEEDLFRLAGNNPQLDRDRLDRLVARLGNDNYRLRQAADRDLRGCGPAVISYLQSLDPTLLDPEQKLRVRRILDALVSPSGDTPERVAAWLSDSKSIWATLTTRGENERRETAAQRLAQLDRLPGGLHRRPERISRVPGQRTRR